MPPAEIQCSPEAFLEFWPRWNPDLPGKNLIDSRVGCSVEHLRDLFFKPSSHFQARLQLERGDSNTGESEWVLDYAKLPCIPGGYSWPSQINNSSCKASMPVPGAMRKVRGRSSGTALYRKPFEVEELQRCVEYVPFKLLVVEISVVSSPMYCDCFRVLNRYTISAESSMSCQLVVEYQIVYVKRVNFLVRGLVERSAHGGMVNNFQKVVRLLKELCPLNEGILLETHPAQTVRCHRLHGLEWELLDDEEVLSETPLTEFTPERESLVPPGSRVPFWTAAQAKQMARTEILPAEAVFRFLCSVLLVFTIVHVAYPHILGMQDACVQGHWCERVFFFLAFPQKIQEALTSGFLLVLLLRVVDWGLG